MQTLAQFVWLINTDGPAFELDVLGAGLFVPPVLQCAHAHVPAIGELMFVEHRHGGFILWDVHDDPSR